MFLSTRAPPHKISESSAQCRKVINLMSWSIVMLGLSSRRRNIFMYSPMKHERERERERETDACEYNRRIQNIHRFKTEKNARHQWWHEQAKISTDVLLSWISFSYSFLMLFLKLGEFLKVHIKENHSYIFCLLIILHL